MRAELPIALDRARDAPLFQQIARALVDDICRGRLKPGDRLPGTRSFARALGVNRVTVLTAYDELAAEGWIDVRRASGARIASDLPQSVRGSGRAAPRASAPASAGYDLLSRPHVDYALEAVPPGVLIFGASGADARLLPADALARAYRRALRRHGGELLSYASPRGHQRLRAALAAMLSSTRGLACSAEQLIVTRGSQMALTLIAGALIRPGEVVAVEDFGYRHAWESFRQAGAKLMPIRVDGEGLDVDALERGLSAGPIRAVYVTPHHQFPTLVSLSADRRMRLLDLARRHRIAIVEDDYDHEFHYDGSPVLPLASLDRAGVVIYVGTLSKVLAPGIRLGYVAGPADLLHRLEARRRFIDIQGDQVVEVAVAELLEDGEVQRHIRRVRRQYRARRDRLVALLRSGFGDALRFTVPPGGIALWVHAPGIDVDAWAGRALTAGAFFQPARAFSFDRRPHPFARLGFAALTEDELREGTARLKGAFR